MGSTLVRLRGDDPAPSSLAFVAGLALHDALSVSAPAVWLKWPNDVLLDQAKLAGILLERVADAVIVGVGVNLVSAPRLPDRATTALADHGGAVERDGFADRLAEYFVARVAQWRLDGWPDRLQADWLARAHPIGTSIAVSGSEGGFSGRFAGLDRDGALLLRDEAGGLRRVDAGDVSLLHEVAS